MKSNNKIIYSHLQLSVQSIYILLGFALLCYTASLKTRARFGSNQKRTHTNTDSHAHVFPAFPRLHVFNSTFDGFTGLSVSFVIGQSDFFGFGFTSLS